MSILVTGGAGFIGSNFILDWCKLNNEKVINLDCLTYAANLSNLISIQSPNYQFVKGDINDRKLVLSLLNDNKVRAIIHFAAESHVDRSISGPDPFIHTNIVGTFNLLEASRSYFSLLSDADREHFRFLHVSTDEVFGSLAPDAAPFTELNRYEPNSPYSSSKAASDHIARAYFHTYNLPVLTTHCSNNYGPFQHREKLIPLCLHNALAGNKLPIYGDGQQIRDWLYVSDHCAALRAVLQSGQPGEVYNIGGWNELSNLFVVNTICQLLDEFKPRLDGKSYASQIEFVTDRPGHDRRYAIDASKIANQLGWKPQESFQSGISKTVRWYLDKIQELLPA